jgi:hypothetical protein
MAVVSGCTQKKFEFSELTATLNPSPAEADYSYQGTAQTKIRLGDRDHVDSVFKDVFGSSSIVTGTTTVESLLQEQVHGYIGYFGGPCDPAYVDTTWMGANAYTVGQLVRFNTSARATEQLYRCLAAHTSSNDVMGLPGNCASSANAYNCKRDNFAADLTAGKWVQVTNQQGCYRRNESQAPMIAGPVPAREALRVQLCETLTGSDTTLKTAIVNAGGTYSTAPSSTEIVATWELFHFGETVPEAVKTALQRVVDTTASTLATESTPPSEEEVALEQWRFLFLTVCRSPSWSIL